MKLESSFTVPAERDRAWSVLMDVPRMISCMPGAKLTEEVSAEEWKAEMAVKLGPIAMTFDTSIAREKVDASAGTVRLQARAQERRARGRATATIESSLSTTNGGTRVDIVTDLSLSGPVAQYGRGVVQDVSEEMVSMFAANLRSQLEVAEGQDPPPMPSDVRAISGIRVGLRAMVRGLARRLRRLFRRVRQSA